MMSKTKLPALLAAAALLAAPLSAPLHAKDGAGEVKLAACEASLGSIAVVEGDTQGWAKYGLGSPRELVNTLARESGCFTPHSAASGKPADFLMNVIAGDSEEVDQSIEIAKSAAFEGLVRSGAATSMLGSVPGAGQLLGMFGGLGGKKKRLAAGIKLISPASGQAIAIGQGEVRKSTLSFGGAGAWNAGAAASGYGASANGKMLVEAFVLAFNDLVDERAAIAAAAKTSAAAAPQTATVASTAAMLDAPATGAKVLRSLRAGTTLTPTGKREGLFIEARDNFGTTGWVSVESLN
jgi:hypothetical protein